MTKEFRCHGANPEKLYTLFNLEVPDHIFDFSTNINAVEQRGIFSRHSHCA